MHLLSWFYTERNGIMYMLKGQEQKGRREGEQHGANNRNPANNQSINSNKSSWSSRGPPIAAVAATTYKSSYQEEVSAMTTVG